MRLTTFSIEIYDDIGPDQEYDGRPVPTILPYEFEGYTDDERWNGWARPYFTIDQASNIVHRHNELYQQVQQYGENPRFSRGLHGEAWYDEQADEFCFPADDAEVERFGPTELGGRKFYAVGSTGWIWDQKGDWNEEEVARLRRISAQQDETA